MSMQFLQSATIDDLVVAIDISTRHSPGGAKCLARAMTLQLLMRWKSYFPNLSIGVMKGKEGALEAHAWVEHEDRVLIGQLDDLSSYTPLPSIEV